MSVGSATNWTRPLFDSLRSSDLLSLRFPVFGATQFQGLHLRNEIFLPKVQVAADYSDSMPESKYFRNHGYHPLEELQDYEVPKIKLPTDAEIAKTTVEANNTALLVFPGSVHCEPHTHPSWADFHYVIDDYGDIFIEMFDDENILLDRDTSNPVTVLIGMNVLQNEDIMTARYGYRRDGECNHHSFGRRDDSKAKGISDIVDWGMRDTLHQVHPIFFSKCLIKVTQTIHVKKLDYPTNRVSITGYLRPAFEDEASYIRRFFHGEDNDSHLSDWRVRAVKDEDNMTSVYDLTENSERIGSTLYKLEIVAVDLFSLYGIESTIDTQDFQDAEADILVHCASNIIERFNENEMKCDLALRSLCQKKKGLNVERAYMLGIDSLGMDVRVIFGLEAKTVRFSFNARTISESAAEKKISRMLFPRKYKKKLQSRSDNHTDLDSL